MAVPLLPFTRNKQKQERQLSRKEKERTTLDIVLAERKQNRNMASRIARHRGSVFAAFFVSLVLLMLAAGASASSK